MMIKESDLHKTTFSSHHGIYQFARIPFVLRNAPASFQEAIDIILSSVHFKYVVVNLDDFIVFSRNVEEHLENIATVLSLLQNSGMTIKLNKYFFMQYSIEYLGQTVKPQQLSVSPKTIEVAQNMTPPTAKKQLRSFLGLCKVFRRFFQDFTSVAAHVNKQRLKAKDDNFTLNDEQIVSLNDPKKPLKSPPFLVLRRDDKRFVLNTGANAEQLGCILTRTRRQIVKDCSILQQHPQQLLT